MWTLLVFEWRSHYLVPIVLFLLWLLDSILAATHYSLDGHCIGMHSYNPYCMMHIIKDLRLAVALHRLNCSSTVCTSVAIPQRQSDLSLSKH